MSKLGCFYNAIYLDYNVQMFALKQLQFSVSGESKLNVGQMPLSMLSDAV